MCVLFWLNFGSTVFNLTLFYFILGLKSDLESTEANRKIRFPTMHNHRDSLFQEHQSFLKICTRNTYFNT